MLPALPRPDANIFLISGAGLSAASGVPTFRDPGGLWTRYSVEDVATLEALRNDRQQVIDFHDKLRAGIEAAKPNPAHIALARLQKVLGPARVTLVTQNGDELLQAAGATEVIELHGSLRRLCCEASLAHPEVAVQGPQDPGLRCGLCGAFMRPAVVFFGERIRRLDEVQARLLKAHVVAVVGTSGMIYASEMWYGAARRTGAISIEVNPKSTSDKFDYVIEEPAEVAVPRIVDYWLEEAENSG